MRFFQRLRNLWNLSVLQFDKATQSHMTFFDSAGNKMELKKNITTIKKKPATIIREERLQEGIIDEGGSIDTTWE